MKEIWNRYDESNIPNDNYEVAEVKVNSEGTKVILIGIKNTVTVKFSTIDSLRITDEGKRIKTYHDAKGIQEYRKDFYGNPVFKVENSEYVEWIVEESAGFYTDMQHYAIVTINDIVDILDTFPPEFTIEEFTE